MDRWRWAPAEFTRPPIIVNIPEFRLRCWDLNQDVTLEMNVVVGQAFEHETPIFQGEMRYVVFRPYWNVPPSIQRKELAPKVAANRSYLRQHAYEVVDENDQVITNITDEVVAGIRNVRYSIRQKPGPENALGAVKFLFPNRNNVYLHSTPAQALFSRSRRDFSHGCIRVEDPKKLAEWVLRDQPEWTATRIAEAMQPSAPENVFVNLKQTIPIYIVYATAVAFDSGEVHFFEDIYGHDATLENALAQGYPYPA
jgi:murein L,D-transpeptidase YcbB/YkuD